MTEEVKITAFYEGEERTLSMSDWARLVGISPSTVSRRHLQVQRGQRDWTPEQMVGVEPIPGEPRRNMKGQGKNFMMEAMSRRRLA